MPENKERDALSISATVTPDGERVFASLLNLDLGKPYEVTLRLPREQGWKISKARVLGGGDIHDHNTFEEPHKVIPKEVPVGEGTLPATIQLPLGSITTLEFAKPL